MAWTVTPEANSEGNVVGFGAVEHQEGFGRFSQEDYIQTDQGVKHVFQDVELADEGSEEFSEDGYWQAVADLYPDTYQALEWAADNVSKELIADYNNALDNDDRREVNRLLDRIVGDYREALQTFPEEPTEGFEEDEVVDELEEYSGTLEEEYDALDEADKEVVDAAIDDLIASEPLGDEVSAQWQDAVYAYQEAGDEVGAAVCAAVAAVHDGSVSQQDAISYIISNFPMKDVVRAYQQLNS
jgi:hypothetical protein